MNEHPAHDLFRGTAWYYARFRPGYPEQFFAHIIERFALDGTGSLLDLGCGTGQIALPLANHFERVIGMDPEPEMLIEATRLARERGAANITWLRGGSHDLPAVRDQLSPLRLVTMGRSFHWMDGDATLHMLHDLIVPGGGVVIAGDGCGVWDVTTEWQVAVRAVIERWLGPERRAGSGVWRDPDDRWEGFIDRAGFRDAEWYHQRFQRQWDADGIIGWLYSTSFCSPALLGNHRESFERDVRATLAAHDPSGVFTETVDLDAILAWR